MIWKKILSLLGKLNLQTILVIAAVVFGLLFLAQCNRSKKLKEEIAYEKLKNDQNLAAMNGILTVVKKQNGDIETSKATYLGSLEEIKQYNSKLYNQLSGQKGLLAGIYSDFTIKLDSIMSHGDSQVQYNDSTYGIKFRVSYNDTNLSSNIDGETKFMVMKKRVEPIYTTIFSNEMKIGITYGFRELDDKYEVFAVSKSDKIKFNELNGVFTLKKPSIEKPKVLKWGVGPSVGVTYSIATKSVAPYVGVGLSYNFIRF